LGPFAFGGIREFRPDRSEEVSSAAILVGKPNPLAPSIHIRMSVMLLPDDYDQWFSEGRS
jgi:putative SOS response-associated peptidase YedK